MTRKLPFGDAIDVRERLEISLAHWRRQAHD